MSYSQPNLKIESSNIAAIGDYNQVTQNIIIQSVDYQDLLKRIATQKRLVRLETDEVERLAASKELEKLEEQEKQFKENVFKLYETFTKIEINTERLKQAKAYFDKGEFREADAILKAEEMGADLKKLIEKDQQLDREKAEVKESREQIANEFLIKARLWITFYDKPNRLQQTCEYFEQALRASKTPKNLFEYALFLQNHNQFNQGEPLYQEALQIYRNLAQDNPSTFLPDVAMTLNNLAILHRAKNELAIAQKEYEEALQIRRNLAQDNPSTFLPKVAITVLNLSIFYLESQPKKSIALAKETIEIARQFPQLPMVQKDAEKANQILALHDQGMI